MDHRTLVSGGGSSWVLKSLHVNFIQRFFLLALLAYMGNKLLRQSNTVFRPKTVACHITAKYAVETSFGVL